MFQHPRKQKSIKRSRESWQACFICKSPQSLSPFWPLLHPTCPFKALLRTHLPLAVTPFHCCVLASVSLAVGWALPLNPVPKSLCFVLDPVSTKEPSQRFRVCISKLAIEWLLPYSPVLSLSYTPAFRTISHLMRPHEASSIKQFYGYKKSAERLKGSFTRLKIEKKWLGCGPVIAEHFDPFLIRRKVFRGLKIKVQLMWMTGGEGHREIGWA